MLLTTKIKIAAKKHLPTSLFTALKLVNTNIISKSRNAYFTFQVRNFKQKEIIPLEYGDNKFKLVIKPENGYLDKQVFAYHKYETHIVDEIMAGIKKGQSSIDIGANIGHHTLLMSQCVGNEGTVYAFEPIPAIREQLQESIAINSFTNISVLPFALGSENKTETLSVNTTNVGGSSIVPVDTDSESGKISIEVKRLDGLEFKKISFIKIDVEGYEYFALDGARGLLEKDKPTVLIEFSPLYYMVHNPTHGTKILELFRSLQYTILDLEDGRKEIIDDAAFIKQFSAEGRSQTNMLCVPMVS